MFRNANHTRLSLFASTNWIPDRIPNIFAYTLLARAFRRFPLESKLLRQIRILQLSFALLLVVTGALCINLWYPFIVQRANVLEAQTINIREKDGTLKAVLSNSAGFTAMGGQRANQPGGVKWSWFSGHKKGPFLDRGRH
jgi:hypothetical protein